MVLDLTGRDWTCGWEWVNCGGGSLASVTPEINPRDSLEDLSKGDNRGQTWWAGTPLFLTLTYSIQKGLWLDVRLFPNTIGCQAFSSRAGMGVGYGRLFPCAH